MKKISLAVFALSCLAVQASASVIWDNTTSSHSWSGQSATFGPSAGFLNTTSNNITVRHVSFLGDIDTDTNIKFVFADSNFNVLDTITVFHTGRGIDMYGTNVNWTFDANSEFHIAALVESDTQWWMGYDTSIGHTQSGIRGTRNGNWSNWNSPTMWGRGNAEMKWQLDSQPVPEPATITLLALASLAGLRRRKK